MNNRSLRFLWLWALIVLYCLLTCSGCVARSESFNDLDTAGFYANVKPDANANYGKKPAERFED